MRKTIAIGINGFVYRPLIQRKPSDREKREVRREIIEFKRAWNLKLLNEGKSNFIR